MDEFAQQLKRRIGTLGMSQAEVARRVGVTTRAFNHYLSGRSQPSLETLLRITEVLQCTPNEVLGVNCLPFTDVDGDTDRRAALRSKICKGSQQLDEPSLVVVSALIQLITRP